MRGERFSVRLPRRMVPIWVSEPTGWPLPRRACSTPLMNVEATAPRPTRRMPRRPSAGWIELDLSSTKSFASKITPLWRPSDMSGICHCAGTRPVLAQCSIVLCLLPSKAASALWPPKRLIIRSAAFIFSSMVDIITNFSLSCKSRQKGSGQHIHLCRVLIAWVEGTANTYACSCW